MPELSHRARLAATLGVTLPLLLAGCKDDTAQAEEDGGDEQAQDEGEDSQVSGFTSGNGSGSGGTGGSAGVDGTGTGTGGTAGGMPVEPQLPDWNGTGFEGDLRLVLGFSYTAPSSLVADPQVGIAAGYRLAEIGWPGVEDVYSPIVYQYAFPPAPEEDSTSQEGPVPAFEWGFEEDYVAAGPAIRLRRGFDGPSIVACQVNLFATMSDPDGFPLYQTHSAEGELCEADAEAWEPEAVYDLELLGGDTFTTNYLYERITTPPSLEDLAVSQDGNDINLDQLGAQVDSTLDIAFSWNGSGGDTRVLIRLIDGDNNLVAAHAADDGDYTIAAEDLESLNSGTLDLLVTRERTDEYPFTEGGLMAVTRFERWGFLEIF